MIQQLVSKVNYFDIKKGMKVHALKYVETGKGECNYYECVEIGKSKIHYLFTHEVGEA